jgi:hypothetical protein
VEETVQNEGRTTPNIFNRKFIDNPFSKITKYYVEGLKKVIASQNDLYGKEIAEILDDQPVIN